MSSIDRDVPIPLYYQLMELLKAEIENGRFRPGDQLPTEDQLCERYGISRTPVREALKEMVREGLLVRTPGKGTFVAQPDGLSPIGQQTKLRVTISDTRWRAPLDGALTLWNAETPQDRIEMEVAQVPLADLRASLITAVGEGQAPDISVLDSVWVAEFAQQRYLRALEEVDPAWVHTREDTYLPSILSANRYQGQLYGMPISADVSVLWFRRDWFAEEGLQVPETWEDLVRVAQHFRKPSVRDRYGMGHYPLVFVGGRNGGETTTHQLLPLLWSASADLISGGHVVLDSPEARRAIEFIAGLVHEHHVAPPEVVEYAWDDAAHQFANGSAALAFGGSYEAYFIQRLANWDEAAFNSRVGFALLPAGPNGRPASLVGGMSYVLYRQSSNPSRALALLERAALPEVLKPFSIRTGHLPPRLNVLADLDPFEDGFVANTIPLLQQARARPSIPEYARVSEQLQKLVEDVIAERWTVETGLTLTTERISGITGLPVA